MVLFHQFLSAVSSAHDEEAFLSAESLGIVSYTHTAEVIHAEHLALGSYADVADAGALVGEVLLIVLGGHDGDVVDVHPEALRVVAYPLNIVVAQTQTHVAAGRSLEYFLIERPHVR